MWRKTVGIEGHNRNRRRRSRERKAWRKKEDGWHWHQHHAWVKEVEVWRQKDRVQVGSRTVPSVLFLGRGREGSARYRRVRRSWMRVVGAVKMNCPGQEEVLSVNCLCCPLSSLSLFSTVVDLSTSHLQSETVWQD